MLECPRCGFSQPQDRYCANCGVDMENFKKSAPSVGQRIFSNPVIYIVLAFLLFCVIIVFVRRHSKEEMANRMQFLKGGPMMVARPGVLMKNNTQSMPAAPPPPPTAAPTVNAVHAFEATTPDENAKAFSDAVQMRLSFAEVDHQTMELLRQDSRATGQFTEFGDFKAGALPAHRRAANERGVRVLFKTSEKLDHEHMSFSANAGESKSDGVFLGITYSVNLTHIEPGSISGEIEVLQNFHESQDLNDPPVRRTYPSTTFELTPGQGWMVTLNLPTAAQEDPESTSAEGVMRIFQSPQYKSRQTEFTLFFDFDKTSSNQNAGKNSQ